MRYSPSFKQCFPNDINYPELPDDVIEISESDYEKFINRNPNDVVNFVNGELTLTRSVKSLDQVKSERFAAVYAAYASAIQQPIEYMGSSFQADIPSQDTLNKTLVGSSGVLPSDFYWVDIDNNKVSMSFEKLQGLGQAMLQQGWSAFKVLQAKKDAIKNAITAAELEAIPQ